MTIMGVDNGVDAPDKSVTVSAAVSGGLGVIAPSSRTLTVTDDDSAPTVTLDLSPSSISENGGSANVTASLSGASSQAVTVVVSASPVSPAVAGDFAISPNDTLTIAPGATRSTGVVTITGVDNGVDAPDKSVTVSADCERRSRGERAFEPDSDRHRRRRCAHGDARPQPVLHKRERRERQRHCLSQRSFFAGGDRRGLRVPRIACGE